MIKNYLKTALRFLKQNKLFAIINALGLSIALAASFIILLYVINENSYDRYNKNHKRIFRVLNYYHDFNKTYSGTPYILATGLKEEFPQIEKAIRVRGLRAFKLKLKEEFIPVTDAIATDSEIFDIYTFPLVEGSSKENLLADQNSIVLSQNLSEKYFPGQNPIGKEITGLINNEENVFIITGVFENIPENSTLKAQCFVNSKWTIKSINQAFGSSDAETSYYKDFWTTWVLLSEKCEPKLLERQFRAFETKHLSYTPLNQYSLQNIKDVYLRSGDVLNSGIQGNIKNVKLFSAIALLILLVATINYIILSTTISARRAKEIGMRKTYGAGSNNIKYQVFSESISLAILVLPVALILMKISMPYAGTIFKTQLHVISSNILIYISVYLVLTIFIGIASGIYTSTYLSGLKVMDILKNSTNLGKRKQYFRSSLIILQLVIFCSFISSTLIIRAQYKYALKKDLGFYTSDILFINLGRGFNGYSTFINNIKSNPNVIMAAGVMDELPMQGSMNFMVPNFQDKNVKVQVEGLDVSFNFLKTMGIMLIEGRDFSEDFGADLTQSAILNETAVKQLGISEPIGKKIEDHTIIGVVKNFNLHSIHSDIPPIEIMMTDKYIMQAVVHYKPGTLNSILPMLGAEWKKAAPDRPFLYTTIEELIKGLYSSEKNLTTLVSIFALFTFLIAALGLFGLTLFVAKSRTKEIGIKKVFGSSENSIVYSFLFSNLILVLVAAGLSVPLTFYFMTKWLNNFAFKTGIDLWIFFASFIVAAIVVILTVSIHSYKASRINPVKALRYE
jgi:putative ABC transport system permease protein